MINSKLGERDEDPGLPERKADWRTTRNSIDDIARRLDELLRTMGDASARPQAQEPVGNGALTAARRDWTLRRERERSFCPILFNPTWDILLDLFIAPAEKREVTTATLSGTLMLSESAIFRCISQLIEGKLVTREEGSSKAGNVRLVLTDRAVGLMRDYYDRQTKAQDAGGE